MRRLLKSPLAMGVIMCVALALGISALPTADATTSRMPSSAQQLLAASAGRTVAQSPQGHMTTRIVGTTASGRRVTGYFIPTDFSRKNGHVRARGMLNGVVHRADGSVLRTFSAMRTLRVKRINGEPASVGRTAAAAAVTCDILHLVLGPLDLNLLGLRVHLNRVVLDITAQSGPGNLLGNLLCAVAGLLDNGLSGLLGQLTNLLDQILAALRLGV